MSQFSTQFTVPAAPAHVIQGIGNVHAWWTGQIQGNAERVGDAFTYRFDDLHRSVQLVESIDEDGVVWKVLEGGPTFTAIPNEWAGTTVRFAVAATADGSSVTLTHEGLLPTLACFTACSAGWRHYASSLRDYLTTGIGEPGRASPPSAG